MHVDDQQTTFRSLAESELDQVNGGLILERLSVVLGIAITGVSLPALCPAIREL